MKKYIYLLIFILSLQLISCSKKKENPIAVDGVIDLRNWDFNKDGNVKLDGRWKFYWKRFIAIKKDIHPSSKKSILENRSYTYANVPAIWNGIQVNNKPIGAKGYASYQLTILFSKAVIGQSFSLKLRDEATAYELYLDGKLLAKNGIVGKNASEVKPDYKHLIKTFIITKTKIDLIMHVSNFVYQKGGLWESLLLGKEEQIQDTKNSSLAFDLFTFGAIIIMSIYHFGLFLLRKNEKSTLYFGFFTLFLAIRTLFRGEMFIDTLFPNMNFHLQVGIEYISFYWSVPIFLLFMNILFTKEFKNIITYIMLGIASLFTLSVLLLPMEVYTKGMMYFQLISLLEGIYIIGGLIFATYRKREGALSAIIGWSIFFLAVVNDTLYTQNIINTGEFAPLGLFIFIFSQSFILSLRFSKAFFSVEQLSENLNKLNIANSRFVPKQILGFLKKNSIVEIKLGDSIQKKMAILFSDIRKFTTMSEKMTPEENFKFLNSYLSRISPVIAGENGFIDKFLGDGIMALFPQESQDAVNAAVKMQEEIHLYNLHRANQNYEPIRTGIGIHSGMLMLGTVGEKNRIDATVISDSVNLTARIESLTKLFGASIIVTENVLLELPNKEQYSYRKLGNVRVVGKSKSILIYEILDGCEPDLKQLKEQTKNDFENGMQAYLNKELEQAIDYLKKVLRVNQKDKAAKYYYQKAKFYFEHKDLEWDSTEIKIK